jgi:hypothetical protein
MQRPEEAHLLFNTTVSVTKLSVELKMRWKQFEYLFKHKRKKVYLAYNTSSRSTIAVITAIRNTPLVGKCFMQI